MVLWPCPGTPVCSKIGGIVCAALCKGCSFPKMSPSAGVAGVRSGTKVTPTPGRGVTQPWVGWSPGTCQECFLCLCSFQSVSLAWGSSAPASCPPFPSAVCSAVGGVQPKGHGGGRRVLGDTGSLRAAGRGEQLFPGSARPSVPKGGLTLQGEGSAGPPVQPRGTFAPAPGVAAPWGWSLARGAAVLVANTGVWGRSGPCP